MEKSIRGSLCKTCLLKVRKVEARLIRERRKRKALELKIKVEQEILTAK